MSRYSEHYIAADVSSRAEAYRKTRKKRKRLRTLITYLAAIVVFCTVYALILPAVTKERNTFCGFEEHIHTEACYGETTALCEICGETINDAVIALAEDVSDKQGEENAPSSNIEPSTDDTSVTKNTVSVSDNDSPSESITKEDFEITKDSNAETATHTDHIHKTPEGFEEKILICKKAEHTHSDICYSDKDADVENESDWTKNIPEKLSSDWSSALVEVAKTQLGYSRSTNNFIINETGEMQGYTRYGAWSGDPYKDPKASFVAFCMHYAGFDNEYFPVSDDPSEWIELLCKKELFATPSLHMITSGDVVFIETDEKTVFPAIVADTASDENNETVLKVIGPDDGGCISYIELDKNSGSVLGYVDTAAAYKEYSKSATFQKVYSDENVTVTATYRANAEIPEDAVLSVTIIKETNKEYENCYTEAQTKISQNTPITKDPSITDFRLYDICLLSGGEETTPVDKIEISISYPSEAKKENKISVVHYAKDGVELSPLNEVSVDENGTLTAEFETDSFSLFAIVTTDNTAKSIVSLQKYNVTSTNLNQLGGKTFAVAQASHGLFCDDSGRLYTSKVYLRSNGDVTGEEELAQWIFERSGNTGSKYYLKGSFAQSTYYLAVSNGKLTTVTDKNSATVFTATRNSTNLTLASGTYYVNINESSPSTGTSAALSLYTLPSNGQVKVVFDGQFGNPTYMGNGNHSGTYYKWRDAQKIETTTDENGYVTLPASLTSGSSYYPMKVNGWYDIVNGIYYDSSMLGKQIKVTTSTTFYPDWVAKTYDIGQNINVIKDQPDTSDFITTKVFDYNELFNVHSCNYNESDGGWYFDPTSELGFIFFDYIQPTGNIGYMHDKDDAVNGITINSEKTNGSRGSAITFPGTITAGIATDTRLNALFGDDEIIGRVSLGEADWLYSYDEETGFYYYNSAKNAASYNQSEQRFYVYDYTVNIDGSGSLNDFIPFNYITDHGNAHANSPANTVITNNTSYCEKGNQVNYWFGMSSEIEFYLPEDSGSGKNYSGHGEEMQFRFSGDDDVWIFIDGELILDLGGVHDVVYGEINFSTGVVKTGQAISSSKVAENTADSYAGMPGVKSGTPAGVTITELPVLEGGKEHTLTVYYLERGSSLSNCAIYFNLSPSYELQITKSDKNGIVYLAEAQFQIFDDPECTDPATLYTHNEDGTLEEVNGAVFTTDEDGILNCFGLLAGKKYYIKEVIPPSGYPDMSKFVIEVDLNERGHPTQVVIDSNKDPWIYADSYVYSSDARHRIELSVYNDEYIGGTETTSFYAEKVWGDGSENIPDEIKVKLYANSKPTSRELILNSENGWKGFFYQLPLKNSEGELIEYTVKETNVPYGYSVSYGEAVGDDSTVVDVPGYFRQVTALTADKYYRFVSTSTGYAVQGSSGSSISAVAVDEENDAQLWKAIKSTGDYFLLQNKAYPTRYLSLSRTSASTSTSTTSNDVKMSIDNNRLKSASDRFMRNASGSSITSTTSSSWLNPPTTMQVYEWVEPTTEVTTVLIPGWRITNTPWDKLTIPIEKIWDDTVPEADKAPLEFELHLVLNGETNSPTKVSSLIINGENDWKDAFKDLDHPGENGYYCIVEKTENYTVTYGGETVYILIDDTLSEAAVVKIDSLGAAETVRTTNSVLYLLPNTGGIGSMTVTLAGVITVISAGLLLAYRYRKKRKEGYDP